MVNQNCVSARSFHGFAISFWAEGALDASADNTRSAAPIADGRYRVNGEVIYVSHDAEQSAFIIDFGVKAMADGLSLLPDTCKKGDFVTG